MLPNQSHCEPIVKCNQPGMYWNPDQINRVSSILTIKPPCHPRVNLHHALHNFPSSFPGVQAINSTASDIDQLAPQLVSAAVRVRQTPKDTSCTERLGQLRRDWTAKIHALTSVVDDVTDFNDFVLMTGMFNLSFPAVAVRRQVLRMTDLSWFNA